MLEYVASNGQQCIDTRYCPNPNTEFDLHISLYNRIGSSSDSGEVSLFGVSEVDFAFMFNHGAGGGDEFFLWSNISYPSGGAVHQIAGVKALLDKVPHISYRIYNEVAYEASVGDRRVNIPKNTHTYTNSIFLLGRCKNGTFENPYKIYQTRIYGLKIYESGVLVRNYIPAMMNGICGLYEEMNGTWHPSFTGVDLLPPTE
jgi:hypothetical protein